MWAVSSSAKCSTPSGMKKETGDQRGGSSFKNLNGCRARICRPFKEPRNRFRAWRNGTTTSPIFRTGPPGYICWRNRFLGSINVYKYGLWLLSPIPPFLIYYCDVRVTFVRTDAVCGSFMHYGMSIVQTRFQHKKFRIQVRVLLNSGRRILWYFLKT